ncbi:ABC transporter permease subunit [Klebsiella michiganensis]
MAQEMSIKRVLLSDVAKLAGLSKATLSRYMNNSIVLPQDTIDRIETAIRELDYRGNSLARRLSKGGSETLGLVLPDITNPFFAELADAAEEAASASGYSLVLCITRNNPEKECQFIRWLDTCQVDGLLLGGLVGAINGFFIAYEGIPAFIVTLATLAVVRGIALLVTQGYSIPVPADSLFTFIGRAWVVGIPMPALIGIMILLIGHIVLNHMRFGRYVTAIGANAEGARRSGINTKAVTMKVYIISGMAAALAGMIITARLGSGSSNQGEGFELQVIAAVVLGSTSLFGGFGTIIGTLLGALSIAVIQNGLILSHISPFYTQIATGTIILLAIWLNTRILNPTRSAAKG